MVEVQKKQNEKLQNKIDEILKRRKIDSEFINSKNMTVKIARLNAV